MAGEWSLGSASLGGGGRATRGGVRQTELWEIALKFDFSIFRFQVGPLVRSGLPPHVAVDSV